MFAIVEMAGQQFKVEKDQQVFVHRLEGKEGSKVTFDNVLLIDNGGKVNVGAPAIKGANVIATVLEHVKGDKVIVFKKKRRKGYKVRNGHRQYLTSIKIDAINEKGATAAAKPAAKKEAAPKAEVKKAAPKTAAAPKAEAKKETAPKAEAKKAAPKKAAAPKAEAKKDAAPKAATKKAAAKPAAKKEDK